MNEYKLTYTFDGGDETFSATRTGRTEAAVRKAFIRERKEMGINAQIASVEFIRDDALATKQQEREALDAIRKIVEELGPRSYLSIAFEGCFGDAEANIENDFGDSYKRRCESLGAKLEAAANTIEQMKNDIKRLSAALEHERSLVKCLNDRFEEQAIIADDLKDFKRFVEKLTALAERFDRFSKVAP